MSNYVLPVSSLPKYQLDGASRMHVSGTILMRHGTLSAFLFVLYLSRCHPLFMG